ncbi:MAG: right-handed parallel beta-helix repeat-containing protein, partial [Planctomycetes bacterium]|nr:right-handed parallel beta-helix repeat-containing protein [Planctomycetota bacterium]
MKRPPLFPKTHPGTDGGHDNWSSMEQLEPRLLLSTYYVATDGDNGAAGGPDSEWATISYARSNVDAGDTIIIRNGLYTNTSEMDTGDNNVTWDAENDGQVTLKNSGSGRILDVQHSGNTFDGIVFDGDFQNASDLIRISDNGDDTTLTDCVVMEGKRDGVDIGKADGVLIDDCVIHDMLYWNDGRDDAHGIVTTGATDLTIRDTEIYYVSGDAFQGGYGSWDNVLIDGCTFWNGDLPSARAGFPSGVNPGENAVDTKVNADSPRATINIEDSTFYGWDSDYIGTASALNLKLKISSVVERCTLYDNYIDLRIRGRSNDTGAHVTVQNCVLYGSVERAIRYEDDVQEMKIYNNTFGPVNNAFFHSPDYPDYTDDNLNNLYWGSVPNEGDTDDSNIAVDSSDFVNSASHNYHLVSGSDAIDAGDNLYSVGVTEDMDEVAR